MKGSHEEYWKEIVGVSDDETGKELFIEKNRYRKAKKHETSWTLRTLINFVWFGKL